MTISKAVAIWILSFVLFISALAAYWGLGHFYHLFLVCYDLNSSCMGFSMGLVICYIGGPVLAWLGILFFAGGVIEHSKKYKK